MMPPNEHDFGPLLRRLRERAGWSQNALAKKVEVNASYINRIEAGQRDAPRPGITLALARALALSPGEVDAFCIAAGHVPPRLQELDPADSTIAAVLGVLTDPRLSPAALVDFRAVVETVALHWSRESTAVSRQPCRHLLTPAGVSAAQSNRVAAAIGGRR